MKQARFHVLALLATLTLAACQPIVPVAPGADAPAAPTTVPAAAPAAGGLADLVDMAIDTGDFTVLVSLIEAAGLVETLKGEGPFTLFAPTDEAFAQLPAGVIDTLLADPQGQLRTILLDHIVPGQMLAADMAELNGQTVESIGGQPLTITVDGDTILVGNATVVASDRATANGVIHVLDTVLAPGE